MKNANVLILLLCLFSFSTVTLAEKKISGEKIWLNSRIKKSTKSIPASLEAYVLNGNVEFLFEGCDAVLNVKIVDANTSETIHEGPVSVLDGVSAYLNLGLDAGDYEIYISWQNVVWYGAFDIE